MSLILASQSPRRQELIQKITDDVKIITSGVDETIEEDLKPEVIAIELAKRKAEAVLKSHKDQLKNNDVLIGCDTIVCLDNRIYGKPKTEEEAYEMLSSLAGRVHKVITGVCILSLDKEIVFSETTRVGFNQLTDTEIWSYIQTKDPFDKAGGYGIQNLPESYISLVDGDLNNVIGLPVDTLQKQLDNFNY